MRIAAPTGRDAELLARYLQGAGVEPKIIGSFGEFRPEDRDDTGALLVAEEALTVENIRSLGEMIANQPSWSDLPFLLMVSGGREAGADLLKQHERLPLGHLTILERPLRPASLLSAIEAALRARKRQYEARELTRTLEKAYAELRMSEQQSRLILQSTHDCIKLLDLKGNLLTMNEEGQKRLGITDFTKVCGLSWMGFWNASQIGDAKRAVAVALSGGNGSFEGAYETPQGEVTWWDIYVTPVRDEQGEIIKLLAVSREITNRKLTEQALIQSEKLAAVGRLASTISHEINNPLEAVTNLIYIALHTDGLPGEAKETLATADEELRRASQIVSQTLKFHRQSTGPKRITVEDLVGPVLALYRGRLANSHIATASRHEAGASLTCFEGELRQVLSNLVGNAIDAMRNGGRLTVRSRRATNLKTAEEGVAITVADSGHGMKPEVACRIFEAFYTTKGDNGTGLGLWITKGIVGKHHGHLSCRSKWGENGGTVFRLFLPSVA